MSNINKVGYQYIGLLNNIPSNLKNSRESGITFRGYSVNEEKSLTQCKIISTKNTEGESVASNLAFYLAGNEPLSNKYDPNEYPALFMENDGMIVFVVIIVFILIVLILKIFVKLFINIIYNFI